MTADLLRQIVEGVLLVFAALFPIVNPLGGADFSRDDPDYDPVERTAANPAGMRSVGCTPHTAMA